MGKRVWTDWTRWNAWQVDLFFYREPEESKDRDEEEGAAPDFAAVEYTAPTIALGGDQQWGVEGAEAGQWEADSAVAPANVAGAEWATAGAAAPAAGWDVGAAPAAPAGWDNSAAPAAAAAPPAGWEPAAL